MVLAGSGITLITFDKNGGGLGNGACATGATSCTIELGPFDQLKVTYPGPTPPSLNKMIH